MIVNLSKTGKSKSLENDMTIPCQAWIMQEGVETGRQASNMDEGTVQTTNHKGSESCSGKASHGRTYSKVLGVPSRRAKTPVGGCGIVRPPRVCENSLKKSCSYRGNLNCIVIQYGNPEGSLRKTLRGL